MKKRLICMTLALGLLLSPALAADMEEKFPATQTYPGYADVAETDWFYDNAKLCYEIGLMNGTNLGFEPGKTLTVGECAAIAARIRATVTGQLIMMPVTTSVWYTPYVNYMQNSDFSLAPILAQPEAPISRMEFLLLLSAALPDREELLPAINSVSALPDSDDETVLAFYNAGILTGRDKYGTFDAAATLTRSEAAAMVSRVARSELRMTFTPADYSPFTAAYLTPGTVMFDTGVTAEEFLKWVNCRILQAEEAAMVEGVDFNWHNILGGTDQTYLEWVKAQVLSDLGVTDRQGTQAYEEFDYQVYYSRLIDLTGETLQPDYGVKPGGLS